MSYRLEMGKQVTKTVFFALGGLFVVLLVLGYLGLRMGGHYAARDAFSNICDCPANNVSVMETDRTEFYQIRGCGMEVVWRCHNDIPCESNKSREDCLPQ